MKYYIKTFGCQMNYSDSERIAGILSAQGATPAGGQGSAMGGEKSKNINEADLIIFNTCGVRQTAEDRAYGQIHNARKNNPQAKIILTGCLANRKDVQRRLKNKVDLFVEIKDFEKIFLNSLFGKGGSERSEQGDLKAGDKYKPAEKTVNFQIPPNPPFPKGEQQNNYLSITPKHTSNFQALVPVMTGCNNFCTYCVVPYARGREISRPVEEITSEIDKLAEKNYKEVILLGQNVNSYHGVLNVEHKTKKIKFPELLNKLAKNFPKINFKFLTSHPKDFSDKLINAIAKNDNISREIHLPFQSGSDKILKAMNRPYTKECYLGLIEKVREKIPAASFTTDVIVGFPGESEKDFRETVKIFKKVNFSNAYINKYSPRPGTVAFSLGDPISWKEKKRREKVLRKLIKSNLNPPPFFKEGISAQGGSALGGKRGCPRNKIIVILGPTASGKSGVAIKLAKKFDGEIISADSRQIYRGMDIGTGKIPQDPLPLSKGNIPLNPSPLFEGGIKGGCYYSENIPHYMIDIASPRTDYNAAKFKKKAEKIIKDILKRNKLPIICGGTGFWIKAIVNNVRFPEVKPDKELRSKLQELNAKRLFKKLEKLDTARAKNIDRQNKVRLIRAIEICKALGKVPHLDDTSYELRSTPKSYATGQANYEFLQIGIKHSRENLHKRIKKNINKRFRQGMIDEVEKLHKDKKLSWKKIQSFGLAYYWIPLYLQNKISYKELAEKIYLAEKNYAKRQATWFRKDKRIKWLENYRKIEREAGKFLG